MAELMPVEWTLPTLYAHVITIINEHDARYTLHFDDMEKSVSVARVASDKALDKVAAEIVTKFATVNEFRGTLSDQAATFITRVEVEATFERTDTRIRELAERLPLLMSRTEALSISDRVTERFKELTDRITNLETGASQARGKGTGLAAGWSLLLGLVSIMAVVFSAWLAFHR
jgi:phage shock protein A